jgi:hypothetical protein
LRRSHEDIAENTFQTGSKRHGDGIDINENFSCSGCKISGRSQNSGTVLWAAKTAGF